MANDAENNPLANARRMLAAKLANPIVATMLRKVGMYDELHQLVFAFLEIERRTDILASVILKRHFGVTRIHEGELDALATMGHDAATVMRISDHQVNCECAQCTQQRLNLAREVVQSS